MESPSFGGQAKTRVSQRSVKTARENRTQATGLKDQYRDSDDNTYGTYCIRPELKTAMSKALHRFSTALDYDNSTSFLRALRGTSFAYWLAIARRMEVNIKMTKSTWQKIYILVTLLCFSLWLRDFSRLFRV
jgi:hypothetical protein